MNVATLIIMPLWSLGDSDGHLLKCRATVISESWAMSKICPWNRFKIRFLVCLTYCIPH